MANASQLISLHERAARFFANGAASSIIWGPLFGFQFIMLWLITLKEDDHFWTNAAGYSVHFRSFIEYFYYSLFGIDTLLILGGTVAAFLLLAKHPMSAVFAFCWLPIIWLMYGVIVYINLSDNLADYVRGLG